MKIFFISLLSYLLGSIPFSYLIAKIYKKNLLQIGSQNVGTANVWRATGKIEPTLFALLGDVGKGYLAMFFVPFFRPANLNLAYSLSAFFSVLGHNWPIFLKFKGGRGLATLAGNLLYLNWRVLLLTLLTITFFIYLFEFLMRKKIETGKNFRERLKKLFIIFTSQILGRVVGILIAGFLVYLFYPSVFQIALPAAILSGIKHIKRTKTFLENEKK